MKTILLLATLLLATPGLAESPADVPAFGSTLASMCYLDRDASSVLPTNVLLEPGTLEGFRVAGTTTSLRVQQIEPGRYSIHLDNPNIKREFRADYDGFAVFALDVDADGQDEIFIESGFGRGTSVYQRELTICRIGNGRFEEIFKTTLNDYYLPFGEAWPAGWLRRYRLLRKGDPGPVDIMLALEIPEGPVATPDTDAQIAMSWREILFRLDESGVYRLAGER